MRDIPLGTIFRGLGPYLAADFARLALVTAVPWFALVMPRALGYL
jgi:TRAP-type C4-dicarboxylate transport system permease large subunit